MARDTFQNAIETLVEEWVEEMDVQIPESSGIDVDSANIMLAERIASFVRDELEKRQYTYHMTYLSDEGARCNKCGRAFGEFKNFENFFNDDVLLNEGEKIWIVGNGNKLL